MLFRIIITGYKYLVQEMKSALIFFVLLLIFLMFGCFQEEDISNTVLTGDVNPATHLKRLNDSRLML